MAKKYYAVKAGKVPGIYTSWADCERQVKGFSGAIYKSFTNKADAESFVSNRGMSLEEYMNGQEINSKASPNAFKTNTSNLNTSKPNFLEENHLIAYIDGSYDKHSRTIGAGGIMFFNGEEHRFSFGENNPKYTAFWNVSGELLAAMYVMNYALENNISKCSLYYDYMGIEMWATKRWKRNNALTEEYAVFCDTIFPHVTVYFHKVAAHTGDTYNEIADQLAKSGTKQI